MFWTILNLRGAPSGFTSPSVVGVANSVPGVVGLLGGVIATTPCSEPMWLPTVPEEVTLDYDHESQDLPYHQLLLQTLALLLFHVQQ
jgi:hypothetical protein